MRVGKTAAKTLATVALTAWIAGCAPPARDETDPANQRLAGTVKAALVRTEDVGAAPVDVVASDGVVTLSGFVDDEREAAAAVAAATATPGVSRVISRLRVR